MMRMPNSLPAACFPLCVLMFLTTALTAICSDPTASVLPVAAIQPTLEVDSLNAVQHE